MPSNEFEANLHCDAQSTREVSNLGHNLVDNGAYANVIEFPAIKPTKEIFIVELGKLDKLEGETRDSHKAVPKRDSQRGVVFDMIKGIFYYVKPICGNDIDLITKSGFPTNKLPERSPIPDAPSILRVIKGLEPDTYRAFILRKTNKAVIKKDTYRRAVRITYTIELSLTPNIESSWSVAQEGVPSSKLIFGKYTPMVKNYIRIYGRTSSGRGQASEVFSFLPE